jgi:hypothetical protein
MLSDCSLRECPCGDDPLTYKNVDCAGTACENEEQTLTFKGTSFVGNFTLSFTDWDNEVWTSYPNVYNNWKTAYDTTCVTDVNAIFEAALERIPNSHI